MHHRKARNNAEKKPAENTTRHDSGAQQKQHNKTQHNTAPDTTAQERSPTQGRHTVPRKTKNTPHHRPQHHTTRHTTPHNTGHHNQRGAGRGGTANTQPTRTKKNKDSTGGGGRGASRHSSPQLGKQDTKETNTTAQQDSVQQGNSTTAPKGNARPQAPQHKTRGQGTQAGHQRQQGEAKRRQHGATGHTQNNRQQHTENRHNQGAPKDTAQAQTGPRRGTTPTATHTKTAHSPGIKKHSLPCLSWRS